MESTMIYDIAAYLYDGGWRADDMCMIAREFDVSAEEAEEIAIALADMEEMA